ncbi:MAG TPA: M3 family metallopeptidase [Candidatus Corynebacterium gallistercoris]|uniref:M3 family metallopeptidase n=1 Tax=Candidatus Corynebacterium gallistercoris TaxID=2838530 RepID=A0A9D1URP9_9CORY|nr:M3 family metallopeptidase [Candidatus Corynebacterium gallistercoris]
MDYFLNPSELPYGLPDFDAVHQVLNQGQIIPAFKTALTDHAAELEAIATNPEEPTWENTFEALERSGAMLHRVLAIVFNYAGTMATDQIRDIEAAISGELAAHTTAMYLNTQLWERIQAIPEQAEGSEEAALQQHWIKRFRRGGAELDGEQRELLTRIDEELAKKTTAFGALLQEETEKSAVHITDEALLDGLSQQDKDFYAKESTEAGHDSGWLIRLGLPTVQPVLERLRNPEARRRVYEASRTRTGGTTDLTAIQTARLRAQRAELLGYASHADFVAEEETAGSLAAVKELLNQVTPAAVANARGEFKLAHDAMVVGDGAADSLTAADWPYWAAQLRAEELSVDEAELKKYFPLEQVLVDGAFFAAKRLYGIELTERKDLKGYHPDVRVWEVSEPTEDGHVGIGLLLTDMYARPTKRGGAWMSSFVDQANLTGEAPVVANVMNIAKPAEGDQALLTVDEVLTVFHEFGHALHGLLSDVRYPSLSGTNVPRDFVEFPSQINENWAMEPEVLANYAIHVETGEPLSDELVEAVRAQSRWGQGFATTEYLAACWLDLAWHSLTPKEAEKITDVDEFEAETLREAGVDLDGAIAPRYRTSYFSHIFAGGYSADYWSYLWAEVLDADGFQAFVDTGAAHGQEDAGHRAGVGALEDDDVRFAGERFRRMILSRGATIDYDDAFWMFRGQQKSVEPLLRRRGLS